jgi:hypothetical protein
VTNTNTLLQGKATVNVRHKALGKIPAPWERILNRRNKTQYNKVITLTL